MRKLKMEDQSGVNADEMAMEAALDVLQYTRSTPPPSKLASVRDQAWEGSQQSR